MPASHGRVVIIGGSMAGLFAAIALRNCGWEVAIYERASEELAGRGVGIATHDELYTALAKAGVDLRDEMGVRSLGRVLLARDGREVGRCTMPQIMTSWGLMYRFLRAQIPESCYHNGGSATAVTQNGSQVTVTFQDGSRTTGDWLIGADGTRSTVRQCVAPEIPSNYCGYFGWRGLIDEARVPAPILDQIAYQMALCLAPGGHWLGYLVAGPNDDLRPGHRGYNWGWYRTADADRLRTHLTDAAGHFYEHGIPHDRIRPELVKALRVEANAQLAPQIQQIIAATERPFIQGMYDLGCARLRHERVLLIGDAAFTARPHIGLGVSKAAEDATTLAVALSANPQAAALDAWEASRLRYGQAALDFSRDLGSYIGPAPTTAAERAKAAFHQQPEVLLAATAPSDPSRWLKL